MWLARNALCNRWSLCLRLSQSVLVRLQAQQLTGISKTRGILVNQNASGGGYYQVQDATGAPIEHIRVWSNCFCRRFSSMFTDGLTLWHADCHVRIFGCFFLGQLQSWNQLDAYSYFQCSCVRTIL